jgi:hypothetical protein
MNLFRPDQLKLAAFAILLLVFQSCTLVPGVRKNDEIKSGKRDEFHELNASVLKNLKAGDNTGLKNLLSGDEARKDTHKLVDSISTQLKSNNYKLLDEYYVINKYADSDTIVASGPQVNRYGLKYPYVTFEEYFAYYLPKQGENKYMLGLIYGKYKDGWKIINLSLAPYTIGGKTGPELYQQARDDYDKTNYPGASIAAAKAVQCIKPAPYWEYPDKDDAYRFGHKVSDYSRYFPLPFVLFMISSGPMILSIGDKETADGAFPMITYMTHYDIKNTAAVKQENIEVNKQIARILPGLAKHYDHICYSAYNEKPTGKNNPPHFDMSIKPIDLGLPVLPN